MKVGNCNMVIELDQVGIIIEGCISLLEMLEEQSDNFDFNDISSMRNIIHRIDTLTKCTIRELETITSGIEEHQLNKFNGELEHTKAVSLYESNK